MQQVTPLVLILIVINVGLFLINSLTTFELNQWFALYYPDNPQYGIWQYVTSMFMHGSLPHLLFNMFGLYMFGSALERVWGSKKFLFFYFGAHGWSIWGNLWSASRLCHSIPECKIIFTLHSLPDCCEVFCASTPVTRFVFWRPLKAGAFFQANQHHNLAA